MSSSQLSHLTQRLYEVQNLTLEQMNNMNIPSFRFHRLHSALHTVLCEIKHKTAPIMRDIENDEGKDQLLRLDNMLVAEGIEGEEKKIENPSEEQEDHHREMIKIREDYRRGMEERQFTVNTFKSHLRELLLNHSCLRPISTVEIDKMIGFFDRKYSVVEIKFKQDICEQVMQIRSRFLDARRKRRNFNKQSTEILNQYFQSHIDNPYPSEEVKEELARQCGITVSQVSNWFGNKRIRYKKSVSKAQDESKIQERAKMEAIEAPNPSMFGMPPYMMPGGMPTGMPVGMPIMMPFPFDINNAPYDPQMMMQYHQQYVPPPTIDPTTNQ